jgi:hypothetical protein
MIEVEAIDAAPPVILHVPPAGESISVVDSSSQISAIPEIGTGTGLIVNVVSLLHPVIVEVPITFTVPTPVPVNVNESVVYGATVAEAPIEIGDTEKALGPGGNENTLLDPKHT